MKKRVLIALRGPGRKRAGTWEFPGGKCRPGETGEACLIREYREEFGVEIAVGGEIGRVHHEYPDISITLILRAVHYLSGSWILREHARLAWAGLRELGSYSLSPADKKLIKLIRRADETVPGDTV